MCFSSWIFVDFELTLCQVPPFPLEVLQCLDLEPGHCSYWSWAIQICDVCSQWELWQLLQFVLEQTEMDQGVHCCHEFPRMDTVSSELNCGLLLSASKALFLVGWQGLKQRQWLGVVLGKVTDHLVPDYWVTFSQRILWCIRKRNRLSRRKNNLENREKQDWNLQILNARTIEKVNKKKRKQFVVERGSSSRSKKYRRGTLSNKLQNLQRIYFLAGKDCILDFPSAKK